MIVPSVGKVTLTLFWNCCGLILTDYPFFMASCQLYILPKPCSKVTIRNEAQKVWDAVQRHLSVSGQCTDHTGHGSITLAQQCGYEIIYHTFWTYISLSVFLLSPNMMNVLHGHCFSYDQDLIAELEAWRNGSRPGWRSYIIRIPGRWRRDGTSATP